MSQRGFRVCPPDMTGIAYRSAYGSSREPNLWTSLSLSLSHSLSRTHSVPSSVTVTSDHFSCTRLCRGSKVVTVTSVGREWSLGLESGHCHFSRTRLY